MNPRDHRRAYATVIVGEVKLPGHVVAIEGCDLEWSYDVSKPVAKGGGDNKYKGKKTQEAIKVTCHLLESNDEHWTELDLAHEKLSVPDGQKAPAHDVRNPIFNRKKIDSVQVKKIGQEKSRGDGNWEVVFEFLQNSPSKNTATGTPNGSKAATGKTGFVEPAQQQQSPADKEIDNLLNKAKEP